MARKPHDRLPRLSVRGVQVAGFEVALVVFHTPPPAIATYTMLASVGCGTMATGRPASVLASWVDPFFSTSALVGPRLIHVDPDTGAVIDAVAAPVAGVLVTVPSVLTSLPSVALGSLCPQRARSRAAAWCMNFRYAGDHSPPYH